ncbi:MAG: TlpA family protein disulfide reductase [Cryobacterium sp.]|nr:TlpA family protein disulfide reductase [Micrococcales bacterium]MBX3310969.1 TlpA family protein disulfide reductase [Cryobacterium sp.]
MRGHRSSARASVLRFAAFAVAGALLLAGCSAQDQLAIDYGSGGNKNYVAGDGSILEIQPENRKDPIVFTGTTDTGTEVSSSDYRGQALVVNFWAGYCAPCRAEAPELEKLSQKWADRGASFLGINTYDEAATAQAFARNYGVTYPSILDASTGAVQLSFAGTVAPSALPTTIVLDSSGRVAARILGQIESASILDAIIKTVVDEDAQK